MVELRTSDGKRVPVEAARVWIPGCPFIVAATLEEADPLIPLTFHEGRWALVDAETGFYLWDGKGRAFGSIEDAIANIARQAARVGMTAEKWKAMQERELKRRG